MILVAYTLSFLCLILNGSLFAHLKLPTPPDVQGCDLFRR